jgi:hypothetical protein
MWPDFRLGKFQMEPNIPNKSLLYPHANGSELLHLGDGNLAGIVYFNSWNLDGLSTTALEQKTASKKHEAPKNWRMR